MKNILQYIYDNLLSIITIIATLIALWQTHKQIKISNKQYLFDKRLSNYLLAKGLLELYKDNESLLDYTDDPDNEAIIVDYQFINLTNNNYLKDVTCIINEPKNNELKNNFLVKIEELKQLSNEVRFLFPNKSGLLLSNFIMKYQSVLMELYKYQIVLDLIKKNPSIRQQELADETGKSIRSIKRIMKSLQDKKYIRRESGKRYGKWEILV